MNRDEIIEMLQKYDYLYDKYKNLGGVLGDAFMVNRKNYRTEYAKGGAVIHRGYYSPSLADLFCGGCSRGRLLKRVPKLPNYDYEYFFDSSNRLVCCKQYTNEWSENALDCMTIEYLLYEKDRIIGLQYESAQSRGLSLISECQYAKGALVRYEAAQVPLIFTNKDYDIDIETHSYKDNQVSEILWQHFYTGTRTLNEYRYLVLYQEGRKPLVDCIATQNTKFLV